MRGNHLRSYYRGPCIYVLLVKTRGNLAIRLLNITTISTLCVLVFWQSLPCSCTLGILPLVSEPRLEIGLDYD